MRGHLRIHSPWAQLGIFCAMWGVAFVLTSMLMLVVLPSNGISIASVDKLDWNDPKIIIVFKWLQALSSLTLFFLPAFLYALFTFTGKYGYFLGLKNAQKINMYVLAIACILLAFPFVFWLGELNQKINLPQWMSSLEKDSAKQMESFLKVKQPSDVIINIIIIALLPAICEELCFRGALQRILIQITRSPLAGIIFTAFLFSALHMQFQGFLPRMFLGILLGALYWYSGSLWTSILAHFVNNAVQVIAVSYAPVYVNKNPSMPAYLALVSAATVFAILYFYRRQSTITYSKVYEPDKLNPTNQFIA